MTTEFVWKARLKTGEMREGVIKANSKEDVIAKLTLQKYQDIKVKNKPLEIAFKIGSGVSGKDIVVFTRQFATMIDAGLPMVQCLEILGNQNPNPNFRKIISKIKSDVEEGGTLASALAKHPSVFDELFVSLVEAGETGGILDGILNRLSSYLEKRIKLMKKIRGAMVYPVTVLSVAILVVLVLLWKVIPVFEKMFLDFGGTLPAPTQMVIDLSKMVQNNIYLIFAVIIGSITAFRLFTKNPKGKMIWHQLVLKSPVFGDLVKKTAVAKFTRTFGTMVTSGVAILDALSITARTAGNKVIEEAILYCREKVSQGKTLAEPLSEKKVFPAMVVQMISVGESTGALDIMLEKIADFYEDEVDAAVGALTSMIEPFMMIFLGTVVGGMIVAMYLPIFEMAGSIK